MNNAVHGGIEMINKCVSLRALLVAVANVALMVGTVSADVVPRGSAPGPGASDGRSDFTVALDLSGYRNAAVAFNFASLMSQNPDAFTLRSATGMSYVDGFRLLSPVRSRRGRARPSRTGRFEYGDGGRSYAMAMFNLAAFDGQSVILNVSLEDHTVASRRGMVNLDNLRISVTSASPVVAAASIPEPTTFTLCAAGLLGMFGAARWQRTRLLFLPS